MGGGGRAACVCVAGQPGVTAYRWLRVLALALVLASALGRSFAETEPDIGVYYFPGWKAGARGLTYPDPWGQIRPYPERRPLLGWYQEGDVQVMHHQLAWMHDYGIKFVAFDWYWDGSRTYLAHAVEAYLAAEHRADVAFTLLWANHDRQPTTLASFDSMVSYWTANYFGRPEYKKLDGMPVVFVFSAGRLEQNAKGLGLSSADLIQRAQNIAKEAGYPGIYFVAGASAGEWAPGKIPGRSSGYSAYSAYNYHAAPHVGRASHSFEELDAGYREHWTWFAANSDLPYIVPMTVGWDKRPWGGSADKQHDLSASTPGLFQAHLVAARSFMRAHPGLTRNLGVICCWNEFGEGSVVEPTSAYQFEYLDAVRSVFGPTTRNKK